VWESLEKATSVGGGKRKSDLGGEASRIRESTR